MRTAEIKRRFLDHLEANGNTVVPSGATTGNVVVTVGGNASNGVPFTPGTASAITLVQLANKDAGNTTSSTLAFPSANTAGNWLAVAIRAGQQGQSFTVTDTLLVIRSASHRQRRLQRPLRQLGEQMPAVVGRCM